MAKFEDVLAIEMGPIAPKGEADRGMSAGTSFQASLGEKADAAVACGPDTTRGAGLKDAADGLKVVALALSILGDATGDPDEEYPEDEGSPTECTVGERPESLRARLLDGWGAVGV